MADPLGLLTVPARKQSEAPATVSFRSTSCIEKVDIDIAHDVARILGNLPCRNANGSLLTWRERDALIIAHVKGLERSYASTAALRWLAIPPALKAELHTAVEQRHSLTPEAIEALRVTKWGNNTADRIVKARRLRHYVPEGSADVARRGLLRLIADPFEALEVTE